MQTVVARLAQFDYSNSFNTTTPQASAIGGVFILFAFLFYGLMIAYIVIHFLSIYNWGTNDAMFFEGGRETKANWFWLMNFVPFGSAVYFFSTRNKVIKAKKEYLAKQQQAQQPASSFVQPEPMATPTQQF